MHLKRIQTTRESAAIQICKDLLEEGAFLTIHDPKVLPSQITKDLEISPTNEYETMKENFSNSNEGKWLFASNLFEIFRNADAVLILTEWNDYRNINWGDIAKIMRKPSWIFDARSILVPKKVKEAGLNFWRIGDGISD